MPTKLYTTKEIADILKFTDRTIREMIKSDDIKAHKIRNEYRISEEQLQEYLTKQTGDPEQPR